MSGPAKKVVNHADLLVWVLWKLQGTWPLTITAEDLAEYVATFGASGPALEVQRLGQGLEIRLTTRDEPCAVKAIPQTCEQV